ncbi:class I SAM-dependent methyltransferase [Actinosynnema sp. NPDC020468]|uniref:class I SAM-dependent methyltransferase n=1 Tax=Actinosynnema sp. NPDC020468 TaxID=3154488 RepID=UPI0034005237
MTKTAQFWEDFYRDRPVWSGNVNVALKREAAKLTPGTALDLGCAEGADAIWLAGQGWRVTGADVSTAALARAEKAAADAGVVVDWQVHDLAETFPAGEFDLVSAQFLHSPVALDGERESLIRRALGSVAPGGVLLVVGHVGWPTWATEQRHHDVHLPTNPEVLASLDLGPDWRVEVDEVVPREVTSPEGVAGTTDDGVLVIRRLK